MQSPTLHLMFLSPLTINFNGFRVTQTSPLNEFQPPYQSNGFNGFSMVLGSFNHWFQWFSMVMDHLSNDTMVSMYRSPLSEILTLAVFRGQLRHILDGVVIFLSIPSCLSWPRKTAKVTCIFFKEFWVFWVNNFETSKYYSGGPKNPEIVQKLFIFDFPF